MSARFLQPALLAAVFFGPLALAAVAYYGPWQWAPRTHHGELIEPPVQLPAGAARAESAAEPRRDSWLLVYARTAPCRERCAEHLLRLHQVRLALADERSRVQIAVVLPDAEVPLPPGARRLAPAADDIGARQLTEMLGGSRIRDGRVFIADPLGRLVISYPPEAPQKGILEDLERLLRLTTIG